MKARPVPGPPSFRTWVALLVVVHAALALLLWEPMLFEGGDNAGYMILGEALRTGEGYRDLHLPGEPLHATYPPLYPAILAAVGWIGGLQLLKLTSLAFTAGAVALTAHLGRRMAGPVEGLAAAAVMAVNPVLLEYAHWVLSEAPFVFLTLLALVLLGGDSGRLGAAGALAAAAAFLTRTAGLPLLVAAAAVAVLQRRRGPAWMAAGVGVVTAGGWAVYQRVADPGGSVYLRQLVLLDPYDPAAGAVGPADLLARAAENVWGYASSVMPGSFLGAGAAPEPGAAVPVLLGLLVASLALAGWIRRAARRLGHPEVFTLLYAALIALWPEVWTDRRFLLPLLPLVVLYATVGADALGRWGTRRRGERTGGEAGERRGRGAGGPWARRLGAVAAGALALLLAVPGIGDAAGRIPDRVECVARYRAGDPCVHRVLASFYAAARWARDHTEPDAVVANRKPRLFYWFSRRKGDVYRYSPEPALVIASLERMGATHVAVDGLSSTTTRYLLPAIRAYRARFDLVYEGGDPPTPILRFRPAVEAALGAP